MALQISSTFFVLVNERFSFVRGHTQSIKSLVAESHCHVRIKVKVTLEQTTKTLRGSSGIALIFL